ncbi:hypothetical protein AKJ45_01730 [candidate division MSBL1 archaeon SCGC-AAA261F19]|uniref:N-acetyltransferase domain-containing protein n=2 Tax=candidate division MSBL1 TaxID=215777 RepID=A0A133VAC8_9EURY|nr:hypothetical protein AKJ43_03335 [candidate division MSBL1 archaeon SCGC-AAA261D19]KXB03394.1 hypothetical protein AKJ45_01730 [candidate division MSBL1 archaeon SCGC-AAA261F19]
MRGSQGKGNAKNFLWFVYNTAKRGGFEQRKVESEEEIIEYSNMGYDCERIDEGKWLMRKEVSKA